MAHRSDWLAVACAGGCRHLVLIGLGVTRSVRRGHPRGRWRHGLGGCGWGWQADQGSDRGHRRARNMPARWRIVARSLAASASGQQNHLVMAFSGRLWPGAGNHPSTGRGRWTLDGKQWSGVVLPLSRSSQPVRGRRSARQSGPARLVWPKRHGRPTQFSQAPRNLLPVTWPLVLQRPLPVLTFRVPSLR